MSFSRVSLFGVLATLTKLGEARIDPVLGGESLVFLGVAEAGKTYSPTPAYGLGPIPDSMAGFDAWRQRDAGKDLPAGQDFTITCDNPRTGSTGGICEYFVSFHACAACTSAQIDGGLGEVLRSEGWTNTRCASTFAIGETTGLKMQTVRRQFVDGESMTVTTTDNLCHIAVFERNASVDCATRFSNAVECNDAFACEFDVTSNVCGSSFCPVQVGPFPPPAPCTCAAGLGN